MAFDSSGDLWVAGGGYVAKYAPGATGGATPLQTFIPADAGVRTIVIDSSGEILLSGSSTNAIYAYAASSSGSATPIRTISGSSTGLAQPYRMVIDGSDDVWVANAGTPGIEEFPSSANGNVAPTLDLDATWASNNGISEISSLAVDHSNGLVVLANDGENVFKFASGVSPSSLYSSEFNTYITNASGTALTDIALDDNGYVYGSALQPVGILIFSPTASGNSLPYAAITAPNSGILADPLSIAVWSNATWWYGGDARHKSKRGRPHASSGHPAT
jgi:hypothetical protein